MVTVIVACLMPSYRVALDNANTTNHRAVPLQVAPNLEALQELLHLVVQHEDVVPVRTCLPLCCPCAAMYCCVRHTAVGVRADGEWQER